MNIVYERADGHVAIATLTEGANVEDVVRKFRDCHPEYTKYTVHNSIDVPKSRQFRDAWVKKDGQVVIDIPKAMCLHMKRIREARNKKLKHLDLDTLRNISNPTLLQEIEDKKQVLRDIPQTFKMVSLDDWPGELK
jgi:hypothetical protein